MKKSTKRSIRLISAITAAVAAAVLLSTAVKADIFIDNGIIYDSDTGCCSDPSDGSYYDPGAGLYYDGTDHMWYNTFTGRYAYSPYVDYTHLYDVEYAAGFTFDNPTFAVDNMTYVNYSLINGKIIQIRYSNSAGDEVIIRKGSGKSDVSGDDTIYNTVVNETVNDTDVRIKGFDGLWYLAVWSKGGYSYSVKSNTPLTLSEMECLISEIV